MARILSVFESYRCRECTAFFGRIQLQSRALPDGAIAKRRHRREMRKALALAGWRYFPSRLCLDCSRKHAH